MPLFISNSKSRNAKIQLILLAGSFLLINVAVLSLHFLVPLSVQSREHYIGVVLDHRERLSHSVRQQKRVLLIGGSSLGFSVSAEDLTDRLGLQVMNLGVNAGMGYANIWNNYRELTDPEKDIIVLSPEYELLYVQSEISLEQCNLVFLSKSFSLLLENPDCLPLLLSDLRKDFWYRLSNSKASSDVYARSAYNRFGDVVSHLGKPNRLFNPETSAFPDRVTAKNVEDYKNFVSREIIGKGYQVVIIPTIIPESVCALHLERITVIFDNLAQLNTIPKGEDKASDLVYCLPDNLFFDTAYHLNQTGRQAKTNAFAEHLESVLGRSN